MIQRVTTGMYICISTTDKVHPYKLVPAVRFDGGHREVGDCISFEGAQHLLAYITLLLTQDFITAPDWVESCINASTSVRRHHLALRGIYKDGVRVDRKPQPQPTTAKTGVRVTPMIALVSLYPEAISNPLVPLHINPNITPAEGSVLRGIHVDGSWSTKGYTAAPDMEEEMIHDLVGEIEEPGTGTRLGEIIFTVLIDKNVKKQRRR